MLGSVVSDYTNAPRKENSPRKRHHVILRRFRWNRLPNLHEQRKLVVALAVFGYDRRPRSNQYHITAQEFAIRAIIIAASATTFGYGIGAVIALISRG